MGSWLLFLQVSQHMSPTEPISRAEDISSSLTLDHSPAKDEVSDGAGCSLLCVQQAILLLYQLTQDDRGKSLFSFHTSGIPFLLTLASETPEGVCIDR